MNTMKHLVVVGFAVVLAAGFVGCLHQGSSHVKLQGRWSGTEAGRTEKITLTFSGNRFAYTDNQSREIGSGTFIVNRTKQPMEMDLTFEIIPSPEHVGKVGLAIFELQGNELKIAGCEPGSGRRPQSIVAGQGVRVFTFNRE